MRRFLFALPILFLTAISAMGAGLDMPSIAQLQSLNYGAFPQINLISYVAGKNFGGGPLTLDATDTTSATDHCTIFVDSAGHRFKRPKGQITYGGCGAYGDDSADDTLPLNYAHAAAEVSGWPIFGQGRTYKITAALTAIDLCRVGVHGQGAIFDGSALTNQTLLSLTINATYCNDPNQLIGAIASHPFDGVFLKGPATGTTTAIKLIPQTLVGQPWIPGVTISNGGIFGFQIGLNSGSGSFDLNLDNFQIGSGGIANCIIFDAAAGSNFGERQTVSHLHCNNYTGVGITITSGTPGDYHCVACSIDGDYMWADNEGGGTLYFTDSHLENLASDNGYLLKAGTENSTIVVASTQMVMTATRTNPIGNSAVSGDSPNQGGITFIGSTLDYGSYAPDVIVDGPGPARAFALKMPTDLGKPALSASANSLRDGNFSSGATLYDWITPSGTGAYSFLVSGGPPGVSTSLQFVLTAGQTSTMNSNKFSCSPSQPQGWTFWDQISGATAASGTFTYTMFFFDSGGNQIGSGQSQTLSADESWVHHQLQLGAPNPAGTAQCQLQYFMTSPSGTSTFKISRGFYNPY